VKKAVAIGGCIGLFVPLFWGIAGMVLFNATGVLAEVFWASVYITCPAWLLPGVWGSPFVIPLLNCGLVRWAGFRL
jgi:hypothetical protein